MDTALIVTVVITALGLLMLVGGGIALAVRGGTSMSHGEVEEAIRQQHDRDAGPRVAGVSTYRAGVAAGRQGEVEVSVDELKEAWRSGQWRRDPQWRVIFSMLGGALLLVFGGFATVLILVVR